jgi:hypothetical protein
MERDMDRKSFFNEHIENLALAQIVRETMLEQEQQQQHVNDDEEDTSASGSSGDSNLRNASMWVAVPDNYDLMEQCVLMTYVWVNSLMTTVRLTTMMMVMYTWAT